MIPPTFLDLFCGCGGFSLGLERAGLRCVAALDFNPEAIVIFRKNFPEVAHVLEKDLTTFTAAELAQTIGTPSIDVIVGGPPCQGFSKVRRVDGANNGERLIADERRHLYQEFLRYVDFFRPKVFVLENVLGIRSASGGEYLARVQQEARALGYRVHAKIEDCVALGVPQKRRRQLFFGTRLDLPAHFRADLKPIGGIQGRPTLWDAIGDLPPLHSDEGSQICEYDLKRRQTHINRKGGDHGRYLFNALEIFRADKLTAHEARPHSQRDLADFRVLREGESSAQAIRRGVVFQFPYNKSTFKDRYTRQSRRAACSTIVAHLSKDGLMFIHPTQPRSLTPREAARVQSFPDWFEFPVSRTHQFRAIGNAVPPLVAESIGESIKGYLALVEKKSKSRSRVDQNIPSAEWEAVWWLDSLLGSDARSLRKVTDEEFKRAWRAVGFLYPNLHPESALDHGWEISADSGRTAEIVRLEPRLAGGCYSRSGWPVALKALAVEGWRRFSDGRLSEKDFFCCDAQLAGACHQNPRFIADIREGRKAA